MSWSSGRRLLFRLLDNWPAKAISVALAIAIVMVYRTNALSTRSVSVPLSVETSHALIAASDFPASVRVTLRGESYGVRSIADGDIEAFVDFSRHEFEGWYRSPVQVRRRGSALEVEPLEITVNPLEVSVRLDRRISMILPLASPVQGSVASGFDLISHSIAPSEIYVSGPVSILADMTEIQTYPVALEGRSADFSVEVGIVSPSPLLSLRGDGIAEFSGVVRPAVPVRSIDGIPIALTGLAPGLSADLGGRTGGVRIEGGRERVEGFVPPPGFLSVDASSVDGPGTHVLPVAAALPADILLIRQDPQTVALIVSAEGGDGDEDGPEAGAP